MTRVEAEALASTTPVEKRSLMRLSLMFCVPALLLAIGLWFWLTSGKTVSTDNAQIGANIANIAPEITGRIVSVTVNENQRVKAGDLLYRIDPAPFRIALMEADAKVGEARLQIAQLRGDYSSKSADIGAMAADVQLARENFDRQSELLRRGFTTRARYDEARAALSSAEAKRLVSRADAEAAHALIGSSAAGGHPQVEAAVAMREKAALDLAHTEIRAPVDGVIAQTDRLHVGTMATAMLPNVSVVGGGDYWVEANFKETQLARIRRGQRAEVKIDALDGKTCPARVTGIGSGTGSEFSLLPAQNATGNWVKVTQRVQVRLKLDCKLDQPLVAGSSAHVTVRVAD